MDDMYPLTVTDGLDRSFELRDAPRRIVSLVPSLTEWLFDLGLDEQIVGVTKFCVHPPEARKNKRIVGGTKNVHLEVIRSLEPDLIVANREENDRDTIEQLMHGYPVYVSDIRNFDMAMRALRDIGICCGRTAKAEALTQLIRRRFEHPLPAVRPSCIYLIWQDPFMTASSDTFIDDLLKRSGFEPIPFDRRGRYPELTEGDIESARPNYILLSSEPYPFRETHREQLQRVFPWAKILCVDGEMFSWYGSRMLKFEGWKYHHMVDNSSNPL